MSKLSTTDAIARADHQTAADDARNASAFARADAADATADDLAVLAYGLDADHASVADEIRAFGRAHRARAHAHNARADAHEIAARGLRARAHAGAVHDAKFLTAAAYHSAAVLRRDADNIDAAIRADGVATGGAS